MQQNTWINVREIRVLIEYQGTLKKFAKIITSKSDASLYLILYGPKNKYYYSRVEFNKGVTSQNIKIPDRLHLIKKPKISIHQSGQIIIRCPDEEINVQINTIPIDNWRGEHLATITCNDFQSLLEHSNSIKTTGSEIDHVIPCDKDVESGRIDIYANAESCSFKSNCRIYLRIPNPKSANPICLGFKTVSQRPLSNRRIANIICITGWNPNKSLNECNNFLYLFAE